MPVGPARAAEPAPGAEVNLALLGRGAAAIALLPLLLLSPAALAGRRPGGRPARRAPSQVRGAGGRRGLPRC